MLQWPRLLLFRMAAVKKTVIIISRFDKVKKRQDGVFHVIRKRFLSGRDGSSMAKD